MAKFSIKTLIKFGDKGHLYRLLKYGEIYMKNIDFYRKYELSNPEHLRGDIYECYDKISQHNTIKFIDNNLEINDLTIFENNYIYTGYLFCMYAIYSDSDSETRYDRRMLDFGEHEIIIHNPKEFINRINQYCNKNNIIHRCSRVLYYPEKSLDCELSPFMKREKYSYQSEARIYIYNRNPQDYFKFYIGNIEDIAILEKCI